jgi:DNA-binding YbaB/EbfC family protein
MKNMGDILRQAQIMQNKLSKLQQEMEGKEIEASSGGGMVTARVSGNRALLGIVIDPKALEAQDVEMLQDLITAAVNEAMRIAKESTEREMNSLTGGIRLPGVL